MVLRKRVFVAAVFFNTHQPPRELPTERQKPSTRSDLLGEPISPLVSSPALTYAAQHTSGGLRS